jgi:hypothetical protein
MLYRTVTIVAIIGFLNLSISCTSVVNLQYDEVRNQPRSKICAVILPVSIVAIGVASEEEVRFVERKVTYDRERRVIRGLSREGALLEVDLSEVRYVELRRTTIDGAQDFRVGVGAFELSALEQPWSIVGDGSVRAGDVVKFARDGGRYDAARNAIVGETEEGMEVEIGCDEVLVAQIRHADAFKTLTRAVLWTGVGVAALLGLVTIACGGECH